MEGARRDRLLLVTAAARGALDFRRFDSDLRKIQGVFMYVLESVLLNSDQTDWEWSGRGHGMVGLRTIAAMGAMASDWAGKSFAVMGRTSVSPAHVLQDLCQGLK
jgi:hypothetical protein